MKPCPYCAEDIQDQAIKCKHCGSMLNAPQVQVAPPSHQGPLPDQIAHGLRRKEMQDMQYHMKIFGWLVLGGILGATCGSAAASAKVGWIVFAVVVLGGGVSTAKKYYG